MIPSPGGYTTEVNGIQLWYKVAGKGKRPILVVQGPGWGLGSAYLEQTFAPLEDQITVIYYDTRGSGRSERPKNAEEINVGYMVEDLEALRQHLELSSFALIGHSHGGYIALNYALKYQKCLSHLILVGGMLGVSEVEADVQRNLPKLAKTEKFAEAAKALEESNSPKSDEEFGALFQRTLPLYFYDPDEGASVFCRLKLANPVLSASAATSASNSRFAVRNDLHKIRVPTLVLVGRHDFITSPEQAQIIQEGIAGSKMVVLEKSGHYPWLEEPDAFFGEVGNLLLNRPIAPKGQFEIGKPLEPEKQRGL